jgi:hypothetical protein
MTSRTDWEPCCHVPCPLVGARFYDAVQLVSRDVTFERNVTISLFEATIRVLGGLLSAHSLVEVRLSPGFDHYM